MPELGSITQTVGRTTLQAIAQIAESIDLMSIDVAAAYATGGGVFELVGSLERSLGASWATTEKRWLTSFDYLRTEPVALSTLAALPVSEVRIHEAERCLAAGGTPRIPFHPKALLFNGRDRECVLAGSGNLSRSGLSRGVEAGLFVTAGRGVGGQADATDAIREFREWSNALWDRSDHLDDRLLTRYRDVFEEATNLSRPTSTEDDVATTDNTRGSLSSVALRTLRVCRHFWIEAGNVSRNRGPGAPGNQLMMKRLSRVFFGFPPTELPRNSSVGTVHVHYREHAIECSLTFSDNGMDKLVLPIPGAEGPPEYDGQNLLFEQTAPRQFRLSVGSNREKAAWRRRSSAVEGFYRMSSGREWGVY